MKKVLVFGNPLLDRDSLALKVAERLRGKVNGIEFEFAESLARPKERQDFYIMDAAVGIKEAIIIEGLDGLESKQPVSGHDFDLAMELKVLKKLGMLGKVRMVAVPADCSLERAAKDAELLLRKIARE